jgi:hypothetical protein
MTPPTSAAALLIVRAGSGPRERFVATTCRVEHGVVHATGRWRGRGPVVARTWPASRVEIRWLVVA